MLFSKVRYNQKRNKGGLRVVLVTALAFTSLGLMQSKGHAFTITRPVCDTCSGMVRGEDSEIWREAEQEFDSYIDREFKRVELFIVHQMWEQSILPALMLSAEQFTVVAMQQAMTIGMFIDAETQMDTQRVLQEIQARAHKDYHPSVGMCEFGSVMKSIASTERRGEMTAVLLSQRSQDRQLGQANSAGMYGADLDQDNRLKQYRTTFCNVWDRNSAMVTICDGGAGANAARLSRIDKDIDYFSLMDMPWTLNLDFTNQEIGNTSTGSAVNNLDEEHVFAMSNNLFGHDSFVRAPSRLLTNAPDNEISPVQEAYLDMRSVVAKRSVAENSFNAIAGMKAIGSSSSQGAGRYMQHILTELGVGDTATGGSGSVSPVAQMLGENPSYYAQMEVLTKKMYQNPDFYTNLYDKPANVDRKAVALQAVKLMQKFDMLKSSLRGEATTSVLLEIAVENLQREVEDQLTGIGSGN